MTDTETIEMNLSEVEDIIKSVRACHANPDLQGEAGEAEITDHYDCKDDIDLAIKNLNAVKELL